MRLVLALTFLAAVLQIPAPNPDTVCWDDGTGKQQCVPLTVVRATFQGYATGGAPPVNQVRQVLIDAQTELADEIKQYRECIGTLGPVQNQAHHELLKQQQDQLDSDNKAAAPPGTVWDVKTHAYITPPLPTGPGRGGRGGH